MVFPKLPSKPRTFPITGLTKKTDDEPVIPNTVKMIAISHHHAKVQRSGKGRSAVHRLQNSFACDEGVGAGVLGGVAEKDSGSECCVEADDDFVSLAGAVENCLPRGDFVERLRAASIGRDLIANNCLILEDCKRLPFCTELQPRTKAAAAQDSVLSPVEARRTGMAVELMRSTRGSK